MLALPAAHLLKVAVNFALVFAHAIAAPPFSPVGVRRSDVIAERGPAITTESLARAGARA